MTKEIQLKQYSISNPAEMTKMAIVLKNHIVNNKLYTNIKGKNYVNVEGWEFAGFLTGVMPRIESVENLSNDREIKWRANVNLYKDDKIMGTGVALCSNKEAIKKSFDEYAVLSMAQTRAIGKAYRNLMGWVIKLAGYETTPAEEVKVETKSDAFTTAKDMIETAKTQSAVMEIVERVNNSKKLTKEQKEELNAIGSAKVDNLEVQNEKK